MYYGHFHHFQQYILPQFSPQLHPINPITTHLSQYSDLNTSINPSTNRSPVSAKDSVSRTLFEEEVGRGFFFTTNHIYNMFTEERRSLMRDQRDLRVGNEIEKERERRGGTESLPNAPLSPPRQPLNTGSPSRTRSPTKGSMQREIAFEKRKVEFDRISDMMIQVIFPLYLLPV